MIFNIDIFYILRGLVYVQPFFWLWFLNSDTSEKDNKILRIGYYYMMVVILILLGITRFSFSQYSNIVLMYYTAFLYMSYTSMREKYNVKDSICLSFLIVFINSYYWEIVLHFNKIIFFGIGFNDVVQAFHLVPAYLLYRRLLIKNIVEFKRCLLLGLIIGTVNLILLNLLHYPYAFRSQINLANRIFCLLILNYIFVNLVGLTKRKVKIINGVIVSEYKVI